jgi:2-polyprenyl-6-methoxyphenol hydroxylase-like FAD-dependent oxidoreductase
MRTQCCIAGGGPAGMMLGFLLARAGVQTIVLEKHTDFFRDFRGDTVHPSTLDLMYELGLLDDFLKLPHSEVRQFGAQVNGKAFQVIDLTHVPTHCKFLVFVPQWDLLDFLADRAKRYATFTLLMNAEAVDVLKSGERVRGVKVRAPEGPIEIEADLVVAADGRHSTLRERAQLVAQDIGAPMDVLWMRVSRKPSDGDQPFASVSAGKFLVLIPRVGYYQCAFLIPKGGFETFQTRGLQVLRDQIAATAPVLADRVEELRTWDDVKLLTVVIDRLKTWYRPGLLCIGDAAHAMSPVGGVGINLAVQDAVATANILALKLIAGNLSLADLAKVQRRRAFPMHVTQRFQVITQNGFLRPVLTGKPFKTPLFFKLLDRWALLRRLPAWFIGVGVRPEHIHSPARDSEPAVHPSGA